MDELYKKVGDEYVKVGGYINTPELYDGVWLVQENKHSKSTTSLVWRIGDIPMADVRLHTSLIKYSDELSSFLMKLGDPDSDEYNEAKERSGIINGPLKFYNWSANDLVMVIIRELGILLQKEGEENSDIKFTNTESYNNRKQKLENITKNIIIDSIIDYLKSKEKKELNGIFNKFNKELLEELLLITK